MNNEINVRRPRGAGFAREFTTSETMTISRFLSDTSANASGSILYLYERMNAWRCKISFLCNTLWVGENRKIERGRVQLNLASLSIQFNGSVNYPVKSYQTLTMTVQSAMTAQRKPRLRSDLSQLTTVLQRDINGKSYSFSQCPPVLIPLLCSEI